MFFDFTFFWERKKEENCALWWKGTKVTQGIKKSKKFRCFFFLLVVVVDIETFKSKESLLFNWIVVFEAIEICSLWNQTFLGFGAIVVS